MPQPPASHIVVLQPSGLSFAAASDQTILQAAKQAGVQMPRSCQNGSCRACRCRMAAGRVVYRIAWPGLSAEEKAQGEILPCVAYAETDLVLISPHSGAP